MDLKTIRDTFKELSYNPSKTARRLDIEYDTLKNLLGIDGEIAPARKPTEPKPADIRTLGKVGLRRWVIAVRACNDPEWPEEYMGSIRQARNRYDAGTHEMYTEVRDGWNILYCQPRKYPTNERNYFRSMYDTESNPVV